MKTLREPTMTSKRMTQEKRNIGIADIGGDVQEFWETLARKIYFTMSDNKTAIVEGTLRSMKNDFYRYMNDYGYKHNHKSLKPAQHRTLRRGTPKSSYQRTSSLLTQCRVSTKKHYGNIENPNLE